jgi:hypothetical protein
MNKSKDYGMKAVKLAGKGQKVFVPAVFVIHLGKTITQATVIQIAVDNLPDIRSGKIHTASRTASHRPEQRFQNGTLHARSNLKIVGSVDGKLRTKAKIHHLFLRIKFYL